MAKLSVLVAPHPVLKKVAAPVDVVDDNIKVLISDMIETMIAEEGIGLAAPQVGISKRIMIVDVPANISVNGEELQDVDNDSSLFKIINPEIIWQSEEKVICNEGCLSIPNQHAEIKRAAEIKIKYLNENGVLCETHFKDLQAVCVQHEIDHLNGILFVDYLSSLKRSMLMSKGKKFASRQMDA